MEQATQPRTAAAKEIRLERSAYKASKRFTDFVGSAVLLVLLSPVMLAIAAATWLDSGLPIIYRSGRLGQHGRRIIVLKFRTMRNGSHHHLAELLTANEERQLEYDVSRKLRDDPRRTRIGAMLRKTSLDELPQLWNVVRGDMTLVGPRPYFPDELLARPEAEELLTIRPGITGLWQVNGRSDRSFEDRVRLDVAYLHRRGFVLDFKILVRTIGAVLSARGAY
ncbi:MAG: sugar transferase [Chloroflexota bacterium]|nr:sugar transferase [Chloroflexota bacterium]